MSKTFMSQCLIWMSGDCEEMSLMTEKWHVSSQRLIWVSGDASWLAVALRPIAAAGRNA